MKATLDIPDDLYRRVEARSAAEGRPLQSVAVQLFEKWLDVSPPPQDSGALTEPTPDELDVAPWLALTRRYVQPGMNHELDDVRAAVAKAWAGEVAENFSLADPKR
jgi:hypothetical protein